MPSKCKATCFPRIDAGTSNVFRNHHGTRYGLLSAIGSTAKMRPTGYVVPGMRRRFMPTYGSGYTLLATRAASTVDGTDVGYHPAVLNPGDETESPGAVTSAELCNFQPVVSATRLACWAPATPASTNAMTGTARLTAACRPRARSHRCR